MVESKLDTLQDAEREDWIGLRQYWPPPGITAPTAFEFVPCLSLNLVRC